VHKKYSSSNHLSLGAIITFECLIIDFTSDPLIQITYQESDDKVEVSLNVNINANDCTEAEYLEETTYSYGSIDSSSGKSIDLS